MHCHYKKSSISTIPLAVLAFTSSFQLLAQEERSNQQIEEVVVTAEKRAESLQDVSLAVTAITGDNMREQGITGIEDLASMAPGLMVSENGGNVEVAMRGIVTTNFVESGDSATSFHVDGVYYARPSSLTGTFYDVERVEVLRGPQGTLYGRNANAGNINVISNKPQEEFDAEIEVGVGSYNQRTFYSMLNSPISDTLSTRFAVNYLKRDGYIKEAFIEDSYNADEVAGRAHLLWNPTNEVSLLVSADYWKTQGDPNRNVITPPGGEPILKRTSTFEADIDNELWGLSAELNVDFENVTLTSITAYRENNRSTYVDGDGNNVELEVNLTDLTQEQFSQELRLSSSSDSKLEWVTGLYYLEEQQNIYAVFGSLITTGLGLSFPQPDVQAESWSTFGQATYDLSDTFRVIAGLRYTEDEKSRTGGTYLAFGIDPKDPDFVAQGVLLSENRAAVDWNKVTWKTGIEWDVAEDSMVYLTVGTGFKAGGYFDGVESPDYSVQYDPEEITAWSLGAKNQFFDHRLQLNTEVFYYTYEGFQVSEVDPIPPFGGARGLVTYNADEAEVYGLEIEALYLVGDNGMLSGTFAYLKSDFTDFEILRNVDETDPDAEPVTVNLTGNELSKAPEFTFSLAYSHSWILTNGSELKARVSGNYSDDYFLTYENLEDEEQDSYTKVDISLSYMPADSGLHISAFANNLTDKLVCTSIGGNDEGTCFSNAPRTVGVKAGFSF